MRSHLVLGCVDWNIACSLWVFLLQSRTSYWGAWIEIKDRNEITKDFAESHLVLGCVDWNCEGSWAIWRQKSRTSYWGAWIEIAHQQDSKRKGQGRTSYWGAWIEILFSISTSYPNNVAPRIGVRGLKSTARLKEVTAFRRTSYWGAWIEINENRCLYSHSDCRTSYWGAWIEISLLHFTKLSFECRTSYWGAWIEIISDRF